MIARRPSMRCFSVSEKSEDHCLFSSSLMDLFSEETRCSLNFWQLFCLADSNYSRRCFLCWSLSSRMHWTSWISSWITTEDVIPHCLVWLMTTVGFSGTVITLFATPLRLLSFTSLALPSKIFSSSAFVSTSTIEMTSYLGATRMLFTGTLDFSCVMYFLTLAGLIGKMSETVSLDAGDTLLLTLSLSMYGFSCTFSSLPA